MTDQEKTIWYLVTLTKHGHPEIDDGPHSDRAGCDEAAYLKEQLGFSVGRTYKVAQIIMTDPKPSSKGVNKEALKICKGLVSKYKGKKS